MVKYFCDCCTTQITASNRVPEGTGRERLSATINGNGHKLTVEILTGLDGTGNAGDFCKYCVLDALYKLDDRPRQS